MGHLDTRGEARRQVGFADQPFTSKADLAALSDRPWRMNPRAPQSMAAFGDAPPAEVFDVDSFNLSPLSPRDPLLFQWHFFIGLLGAAPEPL